MVAIMDSAERRRKLKQVYEVLSLSTEILQDVVKDIASDDSRPEYEETVVNLGEMAHELEEISKDLSRYTLLGAEV